jgi:hypothetical protein
VRKAEGAGGGRGIEFDRNANALSGDEANAMTLSGDMNSGIFSLGAGKSPGFAGQEAHKVYSVSD